MYEKLCPAITILFAALCVATAGCFGSGGANIGQVEGTLLDNGKPVDGAKVTFYPIGGRPSSGSTDADGHFELKYSADTMGAMVGTHEVRINTTPPSSVPQPLGGAAPNKMPKSSGPAIPKQYVWPEEVEVTSGTNEVTFDLKDAKST
ncbi:carboxypeptidase regulatory-like domain-containing protein [Blastopirellula marina]|uniref:Carboxypeptidase regulatory-like domain-containing protein n=1 Tax=Blastopirellula marina TaxID=124 RepID=A0A2S8GJE0_9BACT|nr:carboxypeptidase regulatory-like domain-containing protein [Blastopirellula marina]PQO44558.1 carboxypeptidase regulatory-like domain-containing protein [Blastopirellula marina]